MKKKKVFWFFFLVGVLLCVIIYQYHQFQKNPIILSGIKGDEVAFGMPPEDVYRTWGAPDAEYQEELQFGGCSYLYYRGRVFQDFDPLVLYTFSYRALDGSKAHLNDILLVFSFTEEDECARAVKVIQESLCDAYADDDGFTAFTDSPGRGDREELISIYAIGSSFRSARIYHYPFSFNVVIRPAHKLPKNFFEWLPLCGYWNRWEKRLNAIVGC